MWIALAFISGIALGIAISVRIVTRPPDKPVMIFSEAADPPGC